MVDLHVAFSRKTKTKTYVQDLIKKQGAKVHALLEAGAIVYVCGDGARMEPDVKEALAQLYIKHDKLDVETARAKIVEMADQGRYVLDVWAG